MIKAILRSIISYVLVAIILVIFIIPAGIILLLPKRWLYHNRFFYWLCHVTYWSLLKATFLPITIRGAYNIPQEPAIIAPNHQSALDVPLVGILLGNKPHIWLAKQELMANPFLRFLLKRLAITIDMTTPMTGMRSLIKALDTFYDSHCHAVIFPEGGRYSTLHDFYAGFAILAKKTGRPVVPVRIFNAYQVYSPGSFLIHWMPITVIVGEPMKIEEGESEESFTARVYTWFLAQKED